MAKFGIDPTALALRPSTLIQDRAEKARRQQQATQYQQSRQDAAERFRESMASQELQREADFAKTQFLEEQKGLRERAKTKTGLLEDMLKEQKAMADEQRKDAKAFANAQFKAGNIQFQDIPLAEQEYLKMRDGGAQQPTFQPAGAEGGYDLRTEQPPIQQGRRDISEMYPQQQIIPQFPPTLELTTAEKRQQIEEGIREGYVKPGHILPGDPRYKEGMYEQAPPAPTKPEIPEAVAGTIYQNRYIQKHRNVTSLQNRKKSIRKPLKDTYTKTNVLGKKILNTKTYNAAIKTYNTAITNVDDKIRAAKDKVSDVVFNAQKARKAEVKELAKPTPRETIRQKGIIKYFEDIKEGKIIVARNEGFSHDEKKKLGPNLKKYNAILKKEGSPELELYLDRKGKNKWRLREKTGQVITRGGKKWKVVSFNVDGEPLVEPVE